MIFVAKKLTEMQKREILEGFQTGQSLTSLAKKHGFTPSTITRTVKAFLTDVEYDQLKGKRGRTRLKTKDEKYILNIPEESSSSSQPEEIISEDSHSQDENESTAKKEETFVLGEKNHSENFVEIAPLNSEITWDKQREVTCIALKSSELPQVVYMLVDKKVELESKALKEFPDWSFLSEQDQERLAIPLFSNQRAAKRSCNKNQRVLKVPDSKVFSISSSYLLSKGITRLILDDLLIAIDKND